MFKITKNLYLSNLNAAYDHALINQNNIGIVCRLSDDTNTSPYANNIAFYNFEVEDNIIAGNDMLATAKTISDIVDNAKCNVLVHCNEGRSHSASIVIYYLMTHFGISYDTALTYVKNIKSDVRPNSKFEQCLRALNAETS